MSAEAVTIARGLGDPDLLASTLSKHCSVVMASFTDPRGCASISGELVDLARGRPDPALGLSAWLDHCQTTLLVGDLETSDRYLHQAERQARAVGHPARMWLASAWRAMRLGLRGRFRRSGVQTYELQSLMSTSYAV